MVSPDMLNSTAYLSNAYYNLKYILRVKRFVNLDTFSPCLHKMESLGYRTFYDMVLNPSTILLSKLFLH